ncbi:hypothetical protein [Paenibacillus sp. DS2015]
MKTQKTVSAGLQWDSKMMIWLNKEESSTNPNDDDNPKIGHTYPLPYTL